jgi:hypothetical protein
VNGSRKTKSKMNKPTRGQKVIQKCKFCKIEFEARKADVDRGWGLFCSKSCAAKYKLRINNEKTN